MFMNTAETRHWGRGKDFFSHHHGQVNSQRGVAMDSHSQTLNDAVRAGGCGLRSRESGWKRFRVLILTFWNVRLFLGVFLRSGLHSI